MSNQTNYVATVEIPNSTSTIKVQMTRDEYLMRNSGSKYVVFEQDNKYVVGKLTSETEYHRGAAVAHKSVAVFLDDAYKVKKKEDLPRRVEELEREVATLKAEKAAFTNRVRVTVPPYHHQLRGY